MAIEIADIIYNGLWFGALNRDLSAYVQSSQRYVTGVVRMKLYKGHAQVVGRKSPKSLYNLSLATYDKGDKFDQSAAVGFIHLWGLPVATQAQAQLLADTEEPLAPDGPAACRPEEDQASGKRHADNGDQETTMTDIRGRFQKAADKDGQQATPPPFPFDWRLYPYDIAGSIAHARMLGKQGIITADEAGTIVEGLARHQAADRMPGSSNSRRNWKTST